MNKTQESNAQALQVLNKSELLGRQFAVYGTVENPLFLAKDVAEIIEHSDVSMMIRSLDKEDKLTQTMFVSGQNREVWMLTEDGLYEVLMQSRKPIAKQFKRSVKAILKEIRTKGGYMVARPEETPEQIMARALKIADEALQRTKGELKVAQKQNELLEASNKALTKANDAYREQNKRWFPHYLFSKAVETSKQSILIGELAKIITQKGYEIGQNRLFEWMRENGYLISRVCDMYNQPTQRAMKMGLFEIKKTIIHKPNGDILVRTTPKVTGKGQIYFVERFVYEECNRHSDDWKKGGAK